MNCSIFIIITLVFVWKIVLKTFQSGGKGSLATLAICLKMLINMKHTYHFAIQIYMEGQETSIFEINSFPIFSYSDIMKLIICVSEPPLKLSIFFFLPSSAKPQFSSTGLRLALILIYPASARTAACRE